jgi:hypothetical protein
VSLEDLYNEIGWETLSQRRRKHKLVLMYKMQFREAPYYLQSLLPDTVGASSQYPLINASHLQSIYARTASYSHSFLPTVSDWNSLPEELRNAESIHSFNKHINSDRPIQNPLFSYGKRRSQILHTRIRTNCSALNEHLFRRNVVASPLCQCGQRESPFHYFLECQLYINIRAELLNTISIYSVPSVQTILYGDSILNYQTNTNIAEAVHKYIIDSKRFET